MKPSPDASLPSSLVLVGAGKMGGAMLEGWLEVGLEPAAVTVLDPKPSPEIEALCSRRRIRLSPRVATIAPPEALVLAIKPQSLEEVGPSIDPLMAPSTVLISILAGRTAADLKSHIPHAGAIIRAMPNLPASVGRGATGAAASQDTTDAQKKMAHALLCGVGIVEWLPSENLIDAVTAVSGSGPAYVFYLAECLAQAGAAAGLPRDVAERLARETVAGAGELLARSDLSPAKLRENVTSPGGTTAAALAILGSDEGLMPLMREVVAAAKRRAEELSG